ncbi:MAG: glycoside hydrolase family 127 protein, partial [Bacteroidetes bacterium]
KVNGRKVRNFPVEEGYAVIDRKWKKGDRVELELPMDVRLVAGNSRIQDAQGKVMIMRGPVVYCVEETDNAHYFEDPGKFRLDPSSPEAQYREGLLDGVIAVHATTSHADTGEEMNIMAIPYYAWCNREQGAMQVWLPYEENND